MFYETPILTPRGAPGDPITLSTDHHKAGFGAPRIQLQGRVTPSGSFPDAARDKADMQMAKGVGRLLQAHYGGHLWQVEVDSKQGVCLITIVLLLGNWKYKLPLATMQPADVIRAGGEILERFNIPRSNMDVGSFLDAKKLAVSRASDKPPGS